MKDRFDVVVIGAGIGGLSAGALLAAEGKDVIVIDHRPVPGGVCHSFSKGGYMLDIGPHLLSGCGPNGVVTRQLKRLGVLDTIEFLEVNPLARLIFPDFTVDMPSDLDEFVDNLTAVFPDSTDGVKMLFREMQQVYEEMDDLPSSFSLWNFLKVPVTHPVFMKYPNQTFDTMAEDFIMDNRVSSAIAGLWSYFAIPPSKMSALFWAAVMMGYFNDGGHVAKGGLSALASAYLTGLRSHGGEFLPNHQVEKILVENDSAVGVEVANVTGRWDDHGRYISEGSKGDIVRIRAEIVISNADAYTTFNGMLKQGSVPDKYLDGIRSAEPTLSLIKVSLGVRMDIPAELNLHDILVYDSHDMDDVFRRMSTEDPVAPVDITIPSVTDPSLAPDGCHVVHLWNYAPYGDGVSWDEKGVRIADNMIESAEKLLPGLADAIEVMAVQTPQTMVEYVRTRRGAPYGWTFSPGQIGINRLQPRTPVENLLLSGHWTTPGAGVAGVAMSGENTAHIALQERGKRYLWRKSA